MEYRLAQTELARSAKAVRWLGRWVVALIGCNAVLGCVLAYQASHHAVVLVPMTLNQRAEVQHNRVSATYLEAVAMMLVQDRLNVTPETVAGKDQHLLLFVDSAYYAAFKRQLLADEAEIQQDKVVSTFYCQRVRSQPDHLTVWVSGPLKRWIGERSIGQSFKRYRLRFSMHGGGLALVAFEGITDNARENNTAIIGNGDKRGV